MSLAGRERLLLRMAGDMSQYKQVQNDLTPFSKVVASLAPKTGVLYSRSGKSQSPEFDPASLKAGDVLNRLNDAAIHSREDLVRQLRDVKDDGQVSIGIVRDKKEMTVSAKLEPRTPSRGGRPV